MIKRSLLALAFVCLPMLANANVISLEYTGHFSNIFSDWGNAESGNGHSLWETISGKVEVDLSKATYVDLNGADTGKYQASVSKGLVVGAVDTDAEGWDVVEVYNGTHASFRGDYDDFFQIIESRPNSTLPGWVDSFQLTVDLNGFDWLSDAVLSNVDITTSDYNKLVFSFGVFTQSLSGIDADGNSYFHYTTALFSLDSLKISSTEVPEPSSIALMFIGGLALVLRRRRS